MNDKPEIDFNALTNLVGDKPDVHRLLLQQFNQSACDGIKEIKAASKRQDAEPIRQQSHKLKSSSLSVGADKLASIFQSLESAGKAESWNEIDILISRIDGLYDKIARRIEDFCNRNR